MDDQSQQQQRQLTTTQKSQPQAKRSRPGAQGKPKARTGCVTCKQRRYKCDEARPICGGCVKGGWQCDYAAVVGRVRRLLMTPANTLATQPKMLTQLSQHDIQAFSFFVVDVLPGMEVMLSTPGFRPIVIQTAIAEPFVLHAGLALSLAIRDSSWPAEDRTERARRLGVIMGHYNQAIRSMAALWDQHGDQHTTARTRPDRLLAAMWASMLMSATDHCCTAQLAFGERQEASRDRSMVHIRGICAMLQESWSLLPAYGGEGLPDKNSQVHDHIANMAAATTNFVMQNELYFDEVESGNLARNGNCG